MTQMDLLYPDQLIIAGDFLSDFILTAPYSANLKDAASGRYLLGNQATIELCGLKTLDEFIGNTVCDIDARIGGRWGRGYARAVEVLDERVKTLAQSSRDHRPILAQNGFVRLQDMVKIPVRNASHQIIAILTYSYDRASQCNLLELFEVYKQFYSPKRVAIGRFLRYLKIDRYFLELPTEMELSVLVTMKYNPVHKEVAGKLGIHAKTVETHVGHLREKLQHITLLTLLELLRHEPH